MKVCILGNGLVSLSLASVLIQKNLSVDILSDRKNIEYDPVRTLGISKSNVDYFNEEILEIKKILWDIKKIKVFSENSKNKEILKFNNNGKKIFSIAQNYKLYEILEKKLKKNKKINFKFSINYKSIIKKNYKLIINCDSQHEITKKFFSNRFEKNYNSYAFVTIITHKKIQNNDTAYQNFTNEGPIAFLPISNTKTSVVYSLRNRNKKKEINLKDLIKKFNPGFSILSVNDYNIFPLKSSNLRKYYYQNILAFGDMLHKIHPLAGQGFNMSIRDIKVLSKLIDDKINLGLDIDSSVCSEFQKKIRDKNFIFSTGIDWIYEMFNFESKINSQFISNSINIIGKNNSLNSFFKKFADSGLRF